MTTDSETTEQYLTFVRSRFLISVLVFVSCDFELGRVSVQFAHAFLLQYHSPGGGGVMRRQPSVPYGTNFCKCNFSGFTICLNFKFCTESMWYNVDAHLFKFFLNCFNGMVFTVSRLMRIKEIV